MKKLIAAALSAAIISTAAAPVSFAADDNYTPLLYFRARDTHVVSASPDGNITISRSQLKSCGYTLTADVFVEDELLNCWYVSPKWKSGSEYITLDGLVDPLPLSKEKPNIAYAYAETDSEGNFIAIRHSTITSTDYVNNTMGFTCQIGFSSNRSPLTPYGERSDDYALTSFDMNISPDIPYGKYTVYFLTEPVDYADQRISEIARSTDNGSEVVKPPRTRSLTITVSNLGDIDDDGMVTSADASIALDAYSKSSTGSDHGLSDLAFKAGDIDKDGRISSTDASYILAYYAYLSVSGTLCFEDYLNTL